MATINYSVTNIVQNTIFCVILQNQYELNATTSMQIWFMCMWAFFEGFVC